MTRCLPKIFNTRRAALCGLIGAMSVSVGCQASLRHYRKDEPSLRELAVHPEPWDAEKRDAQAQAAAQPAGSGDRYSARPRERYGFDYDDRPSPYSAKALAKSQQPPGSPAPGRWDQPSEADEAAYLQGLPPELWPLARQQFLASYQYNQRRTTKNRAQSDDQNAEVHQFSDRDSDVPELDEPEFDTAERGTSEPAAAERRTLARSSGPAVYRLRDEDDAPEADRSDAPRSSQGRQTASARPKSRAAAEGSAHYQLRDDESSDSDAAAPERPLYADTGMEEAELPPARPRRQAAELKPPSSRKSSRQLAHAEPIDTGAGDDVRVMPPYDHQAPPARSAEPDQYASRSRRDATETASSEVETKSNVVPASGSRPVQQRPVEAVQPAVDEASQTAAPTRKKLSTQDHLQAALRSLDEESTDQQTHSEKVRHQLTRRMLLLTAGQLEGAMEPIESLEAHEQEAVRHSLQAWHHAIDPKGNPVMARRWPLVLNSLREAAAQLVISSPLEVKNAAFCSNVEGFGSITRFPTTQFRAGQELLLYCEIDNFISEPVKEGFQTQLQGNYEIVDASSRVKVAEVLLPQDVEICKRARRDYFLVYRIYMPAKIAAGRYELRLMIEDTKGKKFGQSSLDFQIGT